MKNFIILFFLFLLSCKNPNQNELNTGSIETVKTIIVKPNTNKKGFIKNLYIGCGYNYSAGNESIELSEPNLREVIQIKSILEFTGLPLNFEIFQANVNNAFATIIDNKRYIIYDKNLFNYVDDRSQNYWTSMSILAHEIGHHLGGHTLMFNSKTKTEHFQSELDADKYSGFILYKMGATLEQAQFAINQLGSEKDCESHPSKYKRLVSIEEGWNSANETRNVGAIPPPQSDDAELSGQEFGLEDICDIKWFKEQYPDYHINDYGIFEGILTDVTNVNGSYYDISIYITKKPTKPLYVTGFENISIEASFDGTLSLTDKSNLPYILKSGRKIMFAFQLEGAGGRYAKLTYLQTIPR